jgi:regulator of RNase E activity RraA
MPKKPLSPEFLAKLRAVDTPTICNAIEEVEGRRRADGFTRLPVLSNNPALPPIVGFAKTATLAGTHEPREDKAKLRERRIAYYRYIAAPPAPSIVVLQDLDEPKGLGAFWGEVNTAVHKGLGVAGALTDGSMRDMDAQAEGFHLIAGLISPSHAHVHITAFDLTVSVFGLTVRPGDLIHADQHGAVIIPPEIAAEIPRGIELSTRKEAPVLKAARAPGFTVDKLIKAWGEADDVH